MGNQGVCRLWRSRYAVATVALQVQSAMSQSNVVLPRVVAEVEALMPYGIALLERFVCAESFSSDPTGVNRAQDVLERELVRLGLHVERWHEDGTTYGAHLSGRLPGPQDGSILILGHVDTVHPTGTLERAPFRVEGHRAYGPGVADMKGGIVGAIIAVEALIRAGWDDRPTIEFLFTPDEEIGSPVSRRHIEARAKGAAAVLNVEPARKDRTAVTSRKGSAHLTMDIVGRAAHAGSAFEQGVSAISELAHKVVALDQLTDFAQGMTVNVGLVSGGTSRNAVAERASAGVHCAFWTLDQAQTLLDGVQGIVANSFVAETTARLRGGVAFLPMVRTEPVIELFDVARSAAQELGMELTEFASMGASDAGFAAHEGVPTLCGLGPVGAEWHSERESIDLGSYGERVQLLAWSMVRAAQRFC